MAGYNGEIGGVAIKKSYLPVFFSVGPLDWRRWRWCTVIVRGCIIVVHGHCSGSTVPKIEVDIVVVIFFLFVFHVRVTSAVVLILARVFGELLFDFTSSSR